MTLLTNWREVLSRAWSLRFIELAAAADIILNFVPYAADTLPRWLTLALLVGAYVARLLTQSKEGAADE